MFVALFIKKPLTKFGLILASRRNKHRNRLNSAYSRSHIQGVVKLKIFKYRF